MADKPTTVPVEIFGQTYNVKAGADPGYVEQLAAHVDAQMREVSRSAGAVDSVRVAVLAALNIADECLRLRAQIAAAAHEAEEKAKRRAQMRRYLGQLIDMVPVRVLNRDAKYFLVGALFVPHHEHPYGLRQYNAPRKCRLPQEHERVERVTV